MADYTAYETEEGACLETVEAYCKSLTEGGSFTDETNPTQSDIERMLTTSYYWVAGVLTSAGYNISQTDEQVLGFLQELQALDVTCKAELANPLTGVGEPNERFIEFRRRRDEMVTMIQETQVLTALGGTGGEVGSLSENLAITGISLSRKRTVESDTDYVRARFRRGQGRNTRAGTGSSADVDYYPQDR